MKKIIFILFLFQLFSVSTVLASDNIVINEFLPHPSSGNLAWVELYNPFNYPVVINNWTLKNDNTTNNIVGKFNITLDAKSFIATEAADNKLTNGGDTIKLFDSGNNEIDSIKYTSDPGIDKSIGRSFDGGDTIVVFSSSTKGYSNNPITPTPTSTPTIEPSSTPTVTPTETPTEIPTATPTQEPTSIPTLTPIPTETPTATVVPTSTPVPTVLPSPSATIHPTSTPINIHEILEKRMKCRFSYSRFARLPNGAMIIDLLKNVFGQNSVCSS